jgi:hypothetical protein
MIKRRGSITLEEHKKSLESNPEYQRMQVEKQARLKKLQADCARDEAELVRELRGVGCNVESVWDLVNNALHPTLERTFVGPYPAAYDLLILHLRVPHIPRIREGIVRALTVRDGPPELRPALLREFDYESDQHLRWAISNALIHMIPKADHAGFPDVKAVYDRGVVV